VTYSREAANAALTFLHHPYEAANRTFRDHLIFRQFIHILTGLLHELITLLNKPHLSLLCAN